MQLRAMSPIGNEADREREFSAAVCLHGHTMHSEECLSFLPRYLHRVPGVSQVVSRYQRRPRPAVDFARAYWTPPLSPASALHLEREQITGLGLRPLVSLSDPSATHAYLPLVVVNGAWTWLRARMEGDMATGLLGATT